MKQSLVIFAGLTLVYSSCVYADTIELKSGEILEGTILRSDENVVLFKTGGRMIEYKRDKIENITDEEESGIDVSADPADEELTSEKEELVKRLLKVNGVRKMVQNNIQAALKVVPTSEQAKLKEVLKEDVLIDLIVPIYADQYFSKDLEKMINFFESPTGQRFVEQSPKVFEGTLQVITEYLRLKLQNRT